MARRPPLVIAFPGEAQTAPDAIEQASTLAGAWLQEQNPRLLSMSTDLHYGAGLWCYVISVAWVVDEPRSPLADRLLA